MNCKALLERPQLGTSDASQVVMKSLKIEPATLKHPFLILQILICSLLSSVALAEIAAFSDGKGTLTVRSMTELKALSNIPLNTFINVQGYYRPGDGGGGTFVYEPDYYTPEAPGRVIIPTNLKGRFIRHYNCETDEVHAEWLGARGDGVSDDQGAINEALRLCKKIVFLPKVYGVGYYKSRYEVLQKTSIWIRDGYQLRGTLVRGKKASTIKLLSGANPATDYYVMIMTREFDNSNNISIKNLILDGNFDGQDTLRFPDPSSSDPSATIPGKPTISLVSVVGGGLVVDNVFFTGYGTGYWPPAGYSHESFVLGQAIGYRKGTPISPNFDYSIYPIPVSRKGATLTNLEFTGVGRNDMFDEKRFTLAEVTHITVGGNDNFSNSPWMIPGPYNPRTFYSWSTVYKASNPICQKPHDINYYPCEQDYPGAPVGSGTCDGQFCDAKIDLTHGGDNAKNYWPSFGTVIEGIKIHDEYVKSGGNISRLHGISVGNAIGTKIEQNHFSNFDGVAIFDMTGWNSNTLIANNVFENVLTGVGLHAARDVWMPSAKASADSPILVSETIKPKDVPDTATLCLKQNWKTGEDRDILFENPRHRNMTIRNNVFTALEEAQYQPSLIYFYSDPLKKYRWSTDVCYNSTGDQIYQSATYGLVETNDYFEPIFENISITNNSFSGRKGYDHKGNELYPTGVYFAVYAPYFKKIEVTNNTFSFPDTPFSQQQLDARKITPNLLPRVTNAISVRFKEYFKNSEYLLTGNLNDNGTEVCPHGVWWDWSPEAPRFEVCAVMKRAKSIKTAQPESRQNTQIPLGTGTTSNIGI